MQNLQDIPGHRGGILQKWVQHIFTDTKYLGVYKRDITFFPPKINTVLGVLVLRPLPSYPESSFLLCIPSFWTLEILWYFSSPLHWRPAITCTRFRSNQNFSQQFMFKIVIQLNICHRLFCIVIICNFSGVPLCHDIQ